MIDEHQEELASLYAFDLLEGGERAQFETRLTGDPELQALVGSLRNAATALALTAPQASPPPELRARIMATVARDTGAGIQADNLVRPPLALFRQVLPWAAAACFALSAAWLGQRYVSSRTEADAWRNEARLAEISLKSTQQQLEAERIIARRQGQDAASQLAAVTGELQQSRTQLADRDQLLNGARTQLADRDRLLADRERQLADARSRLAESQSLVATYEQRIDALAGASAEIGRRLGEANQRVAQLTAELKTQGDLANFKITTLASMLKNSPQALAVAIWDPAKQEGVLKVDKLPALAANQDYQLWVVDPQYPNPVDGGVFTVEPATGAARVQFKSKQPVGVVSAFAVTLERKGGVPKAEGPFVLLGK